ncbi:hypothetical protein [common midwife toad virus -E]|uniref:Uncharacterized protein n=1 Tax=Common midwife toad virus TaxID=540070 RepID=H6WEJ6_9VIRU|nr:hypothetical protein [common midwife toad virus -E]
MVMFTFAMSVLYGLLVYRLIESNQFYMTVKFYIFMVKTLACVTFRRFFGTPSVTKRFDGIITVSFMDGDELVCVRLKKDDAVVKRATGSETGRDYTNAWKAALVYRAMDFEPMTGCEEPVVILFDGGDTFRVEP